MGLWSLDESIDGEWVGEAAFSVSPVHAGLKPPSRVKESVFSIVSQERSLEAMSMPLCTTGGICTRQPAAA